MNICEIYAFFFQSCLTRKGGNNATSKYEFKFDRVFNDQSTQQEVFDEISQLVQVYIDSVFMK